MSRPPSGSLDIAIDSMTPVAESFENEILSPAPYRPIDESRIPDFAFFGVFDGHNGHYVSEALQKSLYPLFVRRLEVAISESNSTQKSVKDCLKEACAQIDRAILGRDMEKQKLLKEERKGGASAGRGGSSIKETLSFAGKYVVYS